MTNQIEVIKIHNNSIDLLQNLSPRDSRLLNSALFGENQRVLFNSEKYYRVDLEKYAELNKLVYRKEETYRKAIESAKYLRDTPIEIKLPDNSYLYTSIVLQVLFFDDLQSVSINWNKDFIPLISGEMRSGKFMFPVVRMAEVSKKRYSLYLLLEKHLYILKKEEKFTLSKEELREALFIPDGKYRVWGDITTRFIKPTLQDMYTRMGVDLQAKVYLDNVAFSKKEVLV